MCPGAYFYLGLGLPFGEPGTGVVHSFLVLELRDDVHDESAEHLPDCLIAAVDENLYAPVIVCSHPVQ